MALKDASANLQRALDIHRSCDDRFAMLSGDDGTFCSYLASGGVGVISVVSHFFPETMNAILKASERNQLTDALSEQSGIFRIYRVTFLGIQSHSLQNTFALTEKNIAFGIL